MYWAAQSDGNASPGHASIHGGSGSGGNHAPHMNGFDASMMPEMASLIRQKERELHDIHEHRCTQLEKLVEAKQASLDEGNKKFAQLKEDFKYNLSLLDARDAEIRRLEGCCAELRLEVQALKEERGTLAQRVDRWQAKDAERREKAKSDAAMQKKILSEVQQELEAARWSMAEELGARQREAEAHRAEAQRSWQQREEALETQRRELTAAFEKLMKQSDDSYMEREGKIASQIVALEQRIESVQNTNASLRSELASAARARDLAGAEAERKEEAIRQLHWRFEDAMGSWKRTEDMLERRVAQAIAEADASRDSMIKQINDAHHEIEKNRLEVARERDLRAGVEEKCKALRREVAEERGHAEAVRRDSLAERARSDTVHAAEVSALQQKLMDVQGEIELHKAAVEATHVTELEEAEGRHLRQMKEWEKKHADCVAERDQLLQTLRSLRSELYEQRTEAGALRLRLELQDANLTQLQVQLQQQQQASKMNANLGKLQQTPAAFGRRDERPLEVSIESLPSPMFSDDFGPVSLPLSPGGFGLQAGGNSPPRRGAAPAATPLNAALELGVRDQEIARLRNENKSLRETIHDMREDLEKLHQADLRRNDESAALRQKDAIIAEQAVRIGDLEGRLAAAGQEAARLRGERKRLMDVGNELRAALFEYQIKYGDINVEGAIEDFAKPPPPPPEEHDENTDGAAETGAVPGHRRPGNFAAVDRVGVKIIPRNPTAAAAQRGGEVYQRSFMTSDHSSVEVEGERVPLVPLPLPPRSAAAASSSERATDSQRRALDRLRQQHLHRAAAVTAATQPRKVINYNIAQSLDEH